MENENLLAASLLDDLSSYARSRPRRQNAARLGRNRQHVGELNLAVVVFLRFHPDHVARGDTILLSTCADHRVHSLSLSISRRDSRPRLPKPSTARPMSLNRHP